MESIALALERNFDVMIEGLTRNVREVINEQASLIQRR
jgi:hypothetical protein